MKNKETILGLRGVVICMLTAATSMIAAETSVERIDRIATEGLAAARTAPDNATARDIIRRMESQIDSLSENCD
jgi:hypothetical protein